MCLTDCPEQKLNYGFLQTETRSKFANQILIFKGLGDVKFGELEINYDNQTSTIKIIRSKPHRRFKGKTYMSVKVTDNFGKQIYKMIVEGITSLSQHEVPMREGYVIEINHVEGPIRLYSEDAIVDITNTTNRWLVTLYGLKNLRIRNDPLYDFVQRLDKNAKNFLGSNLNFLESEDIQHLLIAFISLPQPHRSMYLIKYISMFPKCVVQPIIDNKVDSAIEGSIDVYLKQDVEDLSGTKVQLKLGQDIIVEDTLYEHQTMLHFESIRKGIYSVEFCGKSMEDYVINPQYIEVKDYVNSAQFDFEKMNCSALMDQSIEFYGLGLELFGALRASYEEGSIIMSVMRTDAHPYFPNENYAVVEVTDGDGVSKYRKEITGMNNIVTVDVIPLMESDIIKVYHKEGTKRLKSNNVRINKSMRVNSWLVTKYGLQNRKFKNDPLDELMRAIDSKAGEIVTSPFKYGISYYISEDKKQLLGAIQSLPEAQKYHYLKKYRSLFPKNRGTFTVSFKLDYPEELAGHTIGVLNENYNQTQSIKGRVVTFNYVPYGYYAIKVPE